MYELKIEDVFKFADTCQGKKKEKDKELFFEFCPYCSGGKSGDKDTFSINLVNGAFKCFRSTCNKEGHFVQLARDFGIKLVGDKNRKTNFKQLPQAEIIVRDGAISYLNKRGISADIINKYKITTRKDDENILVFPFYDDENILTFVKYRNTNPDAKSKEWCESETKPILFGMNHIKSFDKPLIITEGQIDCLSVAEAGFDNVVSVPTGAKGFTWFKHCYKWITKFSEIIVFGDCDGESVTLVDGLHMRLKRKIKVVKIDDYLGEKDANDILTKYGKSAIIKAVKDAEVVTCKQVVQASDVEFIVPTDSEHIKSGITALDDIIGGFYAGTLTVLSGKAGQGKSTLISQMMASAIDQRKEIFLYSGELTPTQCKYWAWLQIAGGKCVERYLKNGIEHYTLRSSIVSAINRWADGYFYIWKDWELEEAKSKYQGTEEEVEKLGLLDVIERAIIENGVKLVFIDNLMVAMNENSKDLNTAQTEFVKSLKKLAMEYEVAIILVAHPRKSKDKFENDTVAGSSNITNLADFILNIERVSDDEEIEEDEKGIRLYDSRLMVTKNRMLGKYAVGDDAIKLIYSNVSKRLIPAGAKNPEYSWKKYTENFQKLKEDLKEIEINLF